MTKHINACFKLLFMLIILCSSFSIAQDRSITGTTVVGKISKADIEAKCPGVTVIVKGQDRSTNETIYEILGDHNLLVQTLTKEKSVRFVKAHSSYTAQQLQAVQKLSEALLHYAGVEGWRIKGGSWVKGAHTQDGGRDSKYLCWVCNDCPEPAPPPMMPPSLIPDCPKPANLDELYNEWLKWATMTDVLTELLNAYNLFGFWKGVANMTQDIISAAGLLLPGAGSVAAKGLNMVIKMAVDGALDALTGSILDALGLPDINSKSACEAALNYANNKRKNALAAYNAVWYAYIKCQNEVNIQNTKIQSEIDAWNKVKDEYLKKWADYQKCMDNPNRCSWVECK